MTDEELLNLARTRVPKHLHDTAKLIKRESRLTPHLLASKEPGTPKSFDEAMAAELGKKLPPPAGEDSADVVFHEEGRLGRRLTVVQIRNGKVANILKHG
jgi:hypothetical protein